MSRLPLRSLGLLTAASVLATAAPASSANPVLRHQEDLHGDVVVFGSTLAFDCGAGLPAPAGAIASCASEISVDDTAPDLYWRDDFADASITPLQARTSATLVLPLGSKVTYARLYWAALKDGATPDTDAVLDWLGGPKQTITADSTWVVPYGFATHPTWNYYQASGDATDFVATWGAGDFRVSDVEAIPLAGVEVDRAFSAWTLVVFYENPSDPLRNLALFDSFNPIDPGMPGQASAEVTLSGFLIPPGFTAKMAAFAYEGDATYAGDHFTLNGAKLSDANNPADNVYNSSRSNFGTSVSGKYDVPKLSGDPGSMAGYDLDTVDVTSYLAPGDTSCQVGADSSYDIFFLGGFVTSVESLAPDFNGMTKTVVDLDGGAVLPGDTLQYTITAKNNGNDASIDTVMTDDIQPGLALVPGSIEIVQGGAVGFKTDAAGDDEAEYDAANKRITVRVGSGADGSSGGVVQPGQTVKVRFKVTVTAQSGSVDNQAILEGSGEAGAPDKTWYSDGDPAAIGAQPTTVIVYECDTDAQCQDPYEPHCDPVTHVCGGCTSDADCHDPANPACQPSGACGQCSESNTTICVGSTPVCDTSIGICVLCTLGPDGNADQCLQSTDGPLCVAGTDGTVHCGCISDGDCGDPKSGRVCDSVPQLCFDGCRGMGGNGCPDGLECTSKDTTIGVCQPIEGAGGAGGGDGAGKGQDPGDRGACGCRVPGDRDPSAGGLAAGALLLLGLLLRGRRIRARR